jgi:hypothetical protein
MTSLSNCNCCVYKNQEKIINDQSIIVKQRWLIRDELKKLGFDDNSDIQRLYIDDLKRLKLLVPNRVIHKCSHPSNKKIYPFNLKVEKIVDI